MSESFLHYIWQFQYFTKNSLLTNAGEPVHIFDPGIKNSNAGPDFLNARIKLGEIQWVGNVEIHIDASGWIQHSHQHDEGYDNVILHVVWKNDIPIRRRDGTLLPAIEIGDRVDDQLLVQYKNLINSLDDIPCASTIKRIKAVVLFSTLDKMMLTRLENKAREVLSYVEKNRGDWDETCYQLVAKNFGFKVNAEPFFQLATGVPYKMLMKHSDKPEQVEAILFGVAGFIDEEEGDDDYFWLLKREYNVLRQKYRLDHKMMRKIQWKFLRLRPANFPTLRIAQFAACISVGRNFFPSFLEMSFEELKAFFKGSPSSYWENHFHFSKISGDKSGEMGETSAENILINTVAPVLAAFSIYKDEGRFMDKAIDILHKCHTEENKITRIWQDLSIKSKDAFDSQALLELYNNYCSRRRCLDCNIGASLVKPET
jgi:hypothetical protein